MPRMVSCHRGLSMNLSQTQAADLFTMIFAASMILPFCGILFILWKKKRARDKALEEYRRSLQEQDDQTRKVTR